MILLSKNMSLQITLFLVKTGLYTFFMQDSGRVDGQ